MTELLIRYRPKRTLRSVNKGIKNIGYRAFSNAAPKARFKRRATAVPNSIYKL